ncbi:MAG TPA: CHAT domain-containing tetratricopeptide repeat protein [Candidatus Eisenbacteria bacterium]
MGRISAFLWFVLLLAPAPATAYDGCASADSVVAVVRGAAVLDTARLADALLEQGRCRGKTGQADAARGSLDEGLRLVMATTPPDRLREAAFRHEIGAFLINRRDLAGAAPFLEAARDIRTRELGEPHPDTARTRLYLAALLFQSGQRLEAGPEYAKAVADIEAALGPDHPDCLWAFNLYASYLQATGARAEARVLYDRVLAGRARLELPPDPTEAWLLNNLGILNEEAGDYATAESLYTRSWEIRRDQLGAVPLTARSLVNRGNLFFLRGDYAGARALFEEAMRIFKAEGLDRDPDMARCLHRLGMVYFWTGDVVSAGEHLERARTLLDAQGRTADRLDVFRGLSYCALAGGDARGAERWLRAGIELADDDSTVAVGPRGNLRIDLGRMLAAQHAWSASDRAFADGIGLLESDSAASPVSLGCALYEQGEARLLAGQFREAADDIGASLHLLQPKLEPWHPQLGLCWMGLARAWAGLDHPTAAFETAARAHRLALEQVRNNLALLTERHARLLAASLDEATGLCLATLMGHDAPGPATVLTTWDAVTDTRGLVQRELTARNAAPKGSPAAVQRLRAARTQLANLYLRGPAGEGDDRFGRLLAAAIREREAAERNALGTPSPDRDASSTTDVPPDADGSVAGLLATLPPAAALVAFALTPDSLGPGAEGAGGRYVAFVGRPGRPPQFVNMASRQEVDVAVDSWRAQAGDASRSLRTDPDAAERRCHEAGQRLRRLAWDPLRAALSGTEVVYLVPAGRLGLVSFAALPDSGNRFLVEGPAAIRVIDHERDCRARPPGSGAGLLALGDPDFGCCVETMAMNDDTRRDAADCRSIAERSFQPLPATREEVGKLADRWQRAAPDKGAMEVLLGADAVETAFSSRAAGRRVLHLATHGFSLEGHCRPGSDRGPLAVNAALGSGLVLSGAAHWSDSRAGTGDGLLTAEEVASLDLSSVDLAVLSACESGAGETTAWEGLIGLRRAFEIAGARHLVVSLWSVGDAEARDWIGAFYQAYLEAGEPPPAAARTAALELLRARRAAGRSTHPFYWAGFLTVGGGREAMDGSHAAGKQQARP